VIIEHPGFYGALQAIERLKLKALAIPVDAKQGIDLAQLEEALQRWPVKACWLMTTLQNPLSVTLTPERKQELVELLARYQVPMIEDDVYAELWAGDIAPLPAKAWIVRGTCCIAARFQSRWWQDFALAGLRQDNMRSAFSGFS